MRHLHIWQGIVRLTYTGHSNNSVFLVSFLPCRTLPTDHFSAVSGTKACQTISGFVKTHRHLIMLRHAIGWNLRVCLLWLTGVESSIVVLTEFIDIRHNLDVIILTSVQDHLREKTLIKKEELLLIYSFILLLVRVFVLFYFYDIIWHTRSGMYDSGISKVGAFFIFSWFIKIKNNNKTKKHTWRCECVCARATMK